MKIKFHLNGKFMKNTYSGGKCVEIDDYIDLDRFGFADVAEYIRENLKFSEIGGIYVKGQQGGWQIVSDDKDVLAYVSRCEGGEWLHFYVDTVVDPLRPAIPSVQPHVVIRPRENITDSKAMPLKLRRFVTLQLLEEEKKKKTMEKKESAKRQLAMGGAEKSTYEERRQQNIVANNKVLASLHLKQLAAGVQEGNNMKEKEQALEDSEDYSPTNEPVSEESSDSNTQVKVTRPRKKVQHMQAESRRTTRSQTHLLTFEKQGDKELMDDGKSATPKQASKKGFHGKKKGSKGVVVTTKQVKPIFPTSPACNTRLQRLKNATATEELEKEVSRALSAQEDDGKSNSNMDPELPRGTSHGRGSMEAFIALQELQEAERQKEAQQMDVESHQEQVTAEGKQKKVRGLTKMAKVYVRMADERKEVKLNEKFQPISTDDFKVTEFSLFLGTVARQCVPLDYVSWRRVPDKDNLWEIVKNKYIIPEEGKTWTLKTIHDCWKGYKSRIKLRHYNKYTNDEDRLANRPKQVPLKEFKALLKYWSNEKVKERAEKNTAARKLVTDTHTTGPKTFADVNHELKKKKDDGDEVTLGEMYVATRKRKEGREYKSPTEVINYKLSTIQGLGASHASHSVEQIVIGDKVHGSSYLVGRNAAVKKQKTQGQCSNSTATIEDMTSVIRAQLEQEMEQKVNKKVKENMISLLKKLAEDNPNLTINMEATSELSGDSL